MCMQLINNFKIGLTELQRGVGNVNPMKMARCIMELERIYGIRQGSAGKVSILDGHNVVPKKSQDDLANQIGLERIYGIRQGSNQYCLPNNSVGTQKHSSKLSHQCSNF